MRMLKTLPALSTALLCACAGPRLAGVARAPQTPPAYLISRVDVFDGDPTVDITTLSRIEEVFLDGARLQRRPLRGEKAR